MQSKDNIYNVYCDESRVENPESKNMVIGSLFIPRKFKNKINSDIKLILDKYQFDHELKWTKANKKYINLYKSLIDYFIGNQNINFRCIIVDKKKLDLKQYHNNDLEIAFFKFYYHMLKTKLLSNNKYYIFLDKKPTRDKNIARALHSFLDSYILLHKKECGIKHFQAYSSDQNLLIQFADFMTGVIGFSCNEKRSGSAKQEIADYLSVKINRKTLCATSSLYEEKFNVFVWRENI